MAALTQRVLRRIERDFANTGGVSEAIEIVSAAHSTERVQTAVIICGDGDLARLRQARDLALLDWRDLLMNAHLENEDWPRELDEHLGRP